MEKFCIFSTELVSSVECKIIGVMHSCFGQGQVEVLLL